MPPRERIGRRRGETPAVRGCRSASMLAQRVSLELSHSYRTTRKQTHPCAEHSRQRCVRACSRHFVQLPHPTLPFRLLKYILQPGQPGGSACSN